MCRQANVRGIFLIVFFLTKSKSCPQLKFKKKFVRNIFLRFICNCIMKSYYDRIAKLVREFLMYERYLLTF